MRDRVFFFFCHTLVVKCNKLILCALQAKLDLGESSGSQGNKMILCKGLTIDKKGFYPKTQGEMVGHVELFSWNYFLNFITTS